MYQAYEAERPDNTFRFRDMGTLMRKFRGTAWRLNAHMFSGGTHEVEITRPDYRRGNIPRVMARLRVPPEAVHAALGDRPADGGGDKL
jgi:hypothetical protein